MTLTIHLFIVEGYKRAPAARNVFLLDDVRAKNIFASKIFCYHLRKTHNLC